MNPYESLESFQKKYSELCHENELCQKTNCTKLHPRCFRGVCISTLANNSSNCLQMNNCKLNPFTPKTFKKEFNLPPINGVYRFNICKNEKCDQFDSCLFLHVEWTKHICVKHLLDDCDFDEKHDNLEHVSWNSLKTKVENDYSINTINLGNLCSKENCHCSLHLENLEQYCILYFKGMCPNLICTKIHISWEQFKKGGSQRSSKTLSSCIVENNQIIPCAFEPTPIFLEKAQLVRLIKELQERNTIDIIFIMDCTGSMQPWIEQSSKQIYTIIDCFTTNYLKGRNTIKVGFVGYKDYNDKQKISSIDLTYDIHAVKKFISKQTASGGGDCAEDVIGAIEQAYQFEIERNEESLLITLLFADAPNHGCQYYDNKLISDDYRDKVKQGSLEELMQKYNKLKAKNYFYCVKINESTNKMYSIMKKNFTNLIITEAAKPDQFSQLVTFTLQDTITKSISLSKTQNIKTIKACFYRPKSLPYDFQMQKGKLQYWKNYVKESLKLLRKGQTSLDINLNEILFKKSANQGTSCHIYFLKDTKRCRKMLLKIPNFIFDKYNTIFKRNPYQQINFTDESTINQLNDFNSRRFYDLIIAKQLAMVYRKKLQNSKNVPVIFYVTPIVYELEEPFMGVKQIYAETYIDFQSIEWKKYTNNDSFVDENNQIMTSFSHFTHEETEGEYLVADLQGKMNLLTDPSIQKRESENNKDPMNFQLEGIAKFYLFQHKQCNDVCHQLKLKRYLDDNEQLNTSESFKSLQHINQNQSLLYQQPEDLLIVCDECDEIQKIKTQQYFEKQVTICNQCQKVEQILLQIDCKCCKKKYMVKYCIALKSDTQIRMCDDCKRKCLQFKGRDKCYYCEIDCLLMNQKKQINNQDYTICSTSINYLRNLQCQACQSYYDFSCLIDKDSYTIGKYTCSKCKSK